MKYKLRLSQELNQPANYLRINRICTNGGDLCRSNPHVVIVNLAEPKFKVFYGVVYCHFRFNFFKSPFHEEMKGFLRNFISPPLLNEVEPDPEIESEKKYIKHLRTVFSGVCLHLCSKNSSFLILDLKQSLSDYSLKVNAMVESCTVVGRIIEGSYSSTNSLQSYVQCTNKQELAIQRIKVSEVFAYAATSLQAKASSSLQTVMDTAVGTRLEEWAAEATRLENEFAHVAELRRTMMLSKAKMDSLMESGASEKDISRVKFELARNALVGPKEIFGLNCIG